MTDDGYRYEARVTLLEALRDAGAYNPAMDLDGLTLDAALDLLDAHLASLPKGTTVQAIRATITELRRP